MTQVEPRKSDRDGAAPRGRSRRMPAVAATVSNQAAGTASSSPTHPVSSSAPARQPNQANTTSRDNGIEAGTPPRPAKARKSPAPPSDSGSAPPATTTSQ